MNALVVVLAWAGLVLAFAVELWLVGLLNRVVRPLLEIKRYADRILEGGIGIAKGVDGVDEALRTRELATAVPGLAVAYLKKLGAA